MAIGDGFLPPIIQKSPDSANDSQVREVMTTIAAVECVQKRQAQTSNQHCAGWMSVAASVARTPQMQ